MAGESFAAYLKQVRAHRAELRDSVRQVEDALSSPIAQGSAWRTRVAVALAELSRDFEDHIHLTERPGGVYDSARSAAPRLAATAERLVSEHVGLNRAIAECLEAYTEGPDDADLATLRERATTLVGQLVRHRQRGGDLVYEAYDVDIGGQG
ncbi:hemerythrin domain-containing protein [Ornithinimicrobium sp. F0845]|uniref:hemerythrin domain-containing protein n=1 Tax=Ornithinimicrobium sp. F0845 TaxID=2926412 RepID=UPI001FF522A8|nr:hemerythrin domain-containing protein [Ornithinimicrobium sp. F0845]MCK0110759.1 hemerythrin domain-containing protein [Ornithinimicrobium sp. F0845]